MIHRLLPLLALVSCAPASAPPPDPAPPRTTSAVEQKLTAGPREIIYLVDGVRHSEVEFRRLNLQPDDIDSIQVQKCTDYCDHGSLVIIRLKPRPVAPRTP